MNKVAVILCFNDIEIFHGGSRSSLKGRISYFEQFLILYESLKEHWVDINFEYEVYVLHSISFSEEKSRLLDDLDVKVLKVNYEKHLTKFRPIAYQIDIECDFRLVLDVDMMAVKKPNFKFDKSAQAMYGGNKFSKKQWKEICKFIDCELPKKKNLRLWSGKYNEWSFKEHYLYQSGKVKKRLFPYFNNGAIMIKNSISPEFGKTWDGYRELYTQFILQKYGINIELEGQDVVGLAIDSITEDWGPFERGFNFILQDRFEQGKKLMDKYSSTATFIHYINIPAESVFYREIENAHNKVREKYSILQNQ